MSVWKVADYCEGCGQELCDPEETYCSDYCRWLSVYDMDERQFSELSLQKKESEDKKTSDEKH
jgi:hypothetical protein